MKYIGNYPEQEIVHTWADRYDYVFASDPTITVNPAIPYATWLNSATGELFTCTDNTINSNVWNGNNYTLINESISSCIISYDFINNVTDGTAIDISGNNNNGTIVGAIPTSLGLRFNGISDYVDTNFSSFTKDFHTIIISGRSLAHASHRSISGIDQNTNANSQGYFYFKCCDTGDDSLITFGSTEAKIASPTTSPFDFWLAFNYGDNNYNLYSFGKLVSSVSTAPSYDSTVGNLYVGCSVYDRNRADFFSGEIDKFRFFTSKLTDEEILNIYLQDRQ